MKQVYSLRINGEDHEIAAQPHWSLLEVLRYERAFSLLPLGIASM